MSSNIEKSMQSLSSEFSEMKNTVQDTKERQSYDELQDARKELINVSVCYLSFEVYSFVEYSIWMIHLVFLL
jgi:peroxiredoxin family protein